MTNHASIEELTKLVDKESTLHIIGDDGTTSEVTGTILAATAAGVPFKEKGKSNVDLLTADKIASAVLVPAKPKKITQAKQKPVQEGGMRKHLATYHGVALSWCQNASEADAVTFHETLDHKDLGHVHVAETAPTEPAAPVDTESPDPVPGTPAEY